MSPKQVSFLLLVFLIVGTLAGAFGKVLVVDDFNSRARYGRQENALGFYTDDDFTMVEDRIVNNYLNLVVPEDSTERRGAYWYTLLADDTCFNASEYFSLEFKLRVVNPQPRASKFEVLLQQAKPDCTGWDGNKDFFVDVSRFVAPLSTEFQTVRIPLSSFTSFLSPIDKTRLVAIVFQNFNAAGEFQIDDIVLTNNTGSTVPTTEGKPATAVVTDFNNATAFAQNQTELDPGTGGEIQPGRINYSSGTLVTLEDGTTVFALDTATPGAFFEVTLPTSTTRSDGPRGPGSRVNTNCFQLQPYNAISVRIIPPTASFSFNITVQDTLPGACSNFGCICLPYTTRTLSSQQFRASVDPNVGNTFVFPLEDFRRIGLFQFPGSDIASIRLNNFNTDGATPVEIDFIKLVQV